MIQDFFKFSLTSLKKRQLRSWLTVIGIIIGIGAVVALISLSIGLTSEIERQFELFGTDKLFVSARGMMGIGPSSSAIGLVDEDAETVRKVDGIELVSPIMFQQMPVKFKDEIQFIGVIGIPTEKETEQLFEEVQGFKVEEGTQLEPGDKYKATIGSLYAEEGEVFENAVDVRDRIEISGTSFKVIGIYKEIGNRQDDSQVYVPLDTLREVTGNEEDITIIFAKIKDGADIKKVKTDIEEALRDAKNQDEGAETFQVNTSEDIMRLINQLFGTIQTVLIGIGAISLIVGAVGVMNTMYTSVLERTKEIGIMKSIGATNKDILMLFLIESGVLGLVGGIFGVGVGIGMAKLVEIVAGATLFVPLKAYIGADLVIGALVLAFIMGVVSGVLPARQASKLKPIDALRYE